MWTKDLIERLIVGVENLPELLAVVLARPPINPELHNVVANAPSKGSKQTETFTGTMERFGRSVDQLGPSIDKLAKQARESFAAGKTNAGTEAQRLDELARAAKMTRDSAAERQQRDDMAAAAKMQRETAKAMRDWKPFLQEWPHLRGTVETHVANQIREQMTGGTWASLGFGLPQLMPPQYAVASGALRTPPPPPNRQALLEAPPVQLRLPPPRWGERLDTILAGGPGGANAWQHFRDKLTERAEEGRREEAGRPQWPPPPPSGHPMAPPPPPPKRPQWPPMPPDDMAKWRRQRRRRKQQPGMFGGFWKGLKQGVMRDLPPSVRNKFKNRGKIAQAVGFNVGAHAAFFATEHPLLTGTALAAAAIVKLGQVSMHAAERQIAAARKYGDVNTGIAGAMAVYDVRAMQRDMRIGTSISASTRTMMGVTANLEDQFGEWHAAGTNAKNLLITAAESAALPAMKIAALPARAANWLMEGKSGEAISEFGSGVGRGLGYAAIGAGVGAFAGGPIGAAAGAALFVGAGMVKEALFGDGSDKEVDIIGGAFRDAIKAGGFSRLGP